MYKPKGWEIVQRLIKEHTHFFIYGDPDIDGLYATKLTIDFLKSQKKAYTYYINDNRQHGYMLDITKYGADGIVLIAVDFAMTRAEVNEIVRKGVTVINIDHHEVESEQNRLYHIKDTKTQAEGVIINNTYAFEDDKYKFLSGAGVCYSVYSMIDEAYITQVHKAYVGITLLSDMCVIESQEAQEYLHAAYTWDDAESKYLIDMVMSEKQKLYTFGVQKNMDREFLDYTFNPLLNAMCRCNANIQALQLLMQETQVGDLQKYKEVQNAYINMLQEIEEIDEYTNLIVCKIQIEALPTGDISYGNFIGILANRLVNTLQKSVLIYMMHGTKLVRGSFRGYYTGMNYLQICKQQQIQCEGHKEAFGILSMSITQDLFRRVDDAITAANVTYRKEYKETAIQIKVKNLQRQIQIDKKSVLYNAYVRNAYRVYYDCRECVYEKYKESKLKTYIEYKIDGVIVKCFTAQLTPKDGLVLPMLSNGYITYTLVPQLH
jgi:single-stranded-DNA-specific exonuclease